MAASASTSGYANNNYSYDVFISHRGPDVKKTFASYLYRRLTSYGLQVFLDYQELEEGQNFENQIKDAIASASIHVPIFSPRYLQSKWCLEELHLMLESKSLIIPVFYKVKPAALRWTQDLNIHERRYNSATVEKWRKALKSVADISGFDLEKFNGDEGELLDQVVECVLKNLKRDLYVADYPVGLDEKAQVFQWRVLWQQPSGRAQVVGIAGPPGVGKTTLAKELFNRKRSNYRNHCFLFNVREKAKSCLPSLQRKLLKGLIKLDQDIDNVDEGKWMLKKHLSKFPVLIVLDDVDDEDHVDALLPVNDLKPESLILITSRDRIVLASSGIQSICQLTGLDQHYSRELFCFYAFGQPHPPSEFESLVHQFLQACNGLPLGLKLLGKLFSRNANKSYWEDQLKRLKQTLHKGIPKSLQVSYDAFDGDAKLKIGGGSGGTGSLGFLRPLWLGSLGLLRPLWLGSLGFLRPLWLDTGNTTGMHDQLTDLGRDLAKHPELLRLLWRGIEDIHDLKHKKFVLKSVIHCEGCSRMLLRAIARVKGVDSVEVDMLEDKITVIGEVDPVSLIKNLYRRFPKLSVGPGPKEKFLLFSQAKRGPWRIQVCFPKIRIEHPSSGFRL